MSQPLQAGFEEVTVSQAETIGLPNWSFVAVFASAKTTAPIQQSKLAHDFLFSNINAFIAEQCETITRALNKWAGVESVAAKKRAELLTADDLGISPVEVVFSLKETVGLPEKSNVQMFAASKIAVSPDKITEGFQHVAESVTYQMSGKRDLVLADPRPWTSN